MDFVDQCEKRKKLRAQLLKEWNESDIKKTAKSNKLSVSLCKRESPRSRFLKKEHNKPEPGDKITYMVGMRKAPKIKPYFVPTRSKS